MSDINTSTSSPIQYTSRTARTILNDINSVPELADTPEFWKRIWSGVGDTMSLILNAAVNDNFLRTSFTRRSVHDIVRLIDYSPSAQTTASGSLTFNLADAVTFPVSINRADLVALSQGTLAISARRYEARQSISLTPTSTTVTADSGTDLLTVAAGTYVTGGKVRFTTTGTLPAPLATATSYFLIRVTDTTYRVAETLENARANTFIDITSAGSGVHTMQPYYVTVDAFQQETRDQYSIGQSDGTTEWQEYTLDDLNVLLDTETIIINSITWTRVDTLVDSLPTDTHYRLLYNSDNSAFIQFGDGTYGAIPPAFDIFASYAFGGGTTANISNVNRITTYAGSSADVDTVFNSTVFTGGAAAEAIETSKRLGPLLLKTRARFVTTQDGEVLALNFGGLSQVRVNKNAFGPLSAQVVGVANGGGNPTSVLRGQIQTDLIDRSLLEQIDVRVQETTITSVNVSAGIRLLPGFSFALVQSYTILGWQLFLTDTGVEITDRFVSEGVTAATTLINSIFSTSFGESDYAQIELFLDSMQRGAQAPRRISEDVQESDAFAFIAGNVNGVDFMTITTPTFPITLADDEITTDGTILISEI